MLLSMTGHGAGRIQQDGVAVSVEVRTVNNRYYKLSLRSPEGYAALESRIDDVIRQSIRRGSVYCDLRVERAPTSDNYRLNETALNAYYQQLRRLQTAAGNPSDVRWELLLPLPGVVNEESTTRNAEEDWPLIERTIHLALDGLARMRGEEGEAMSRDLAENSEAIARELVEVDKLAPLVSGSYRGRLQERLNKLLAEYGVSVQPADIVREVGLFAERCDVSEEIVRLRSHLDQFREIMSSAESNGRKLEFVTQEMFREANTIGSKSNDAAMSRHVIEIKTVIERIREMIQNIE